jgi:hypothetical protein
MAKIQQKKCHALPSTSQQKMPDVNPSYLGHLVIMMPARFLHLKWLSPFSLIIDYYFIENPSQIRSECLVPPEIFTHQA